MRVRRGSGGGRRGLSHGSRVRGRTNNRFKPGSPKTFASAAEAITMTARLVPIKTAPREFKEALVMAMGYRLDGKQILRPDGEKYLDPYANVPVSIDNMIILPGSTLILDDNALSIAAYIDEHPDVL